VLEHLERHVGFGETERDGLRADADLARDLQELLAVGAGVGSHRAEFLFVEEMLFIVQYWNIPMLDYGLACESS